MIGISSNLQPYQAVSAEHSSRSQEVKDIQEAYKESKVAQISQILSEVQALVKGRAEGESFEIQHQEFKDFLNDIGYEGEPIASLSQEEAAELVSEEGFFGVAKTSERIAQFVISGAGGDEELLREGRKGILQGFKEAENIFGGKLPDISYETIEKAVSLIDNALKEGGFSVLDETV